MNSYLEFRIMFRVPANDRHGSYLSETFESATDKINAVGRFLAAHPTYIVLSVFNGR